MEATKLLMRQHREIDRLFERFEAAGDDASETREQVRQKLSDALAVHAAVEEKIFYPATKDARTADLLHEALEEHLAVKRIVADLLQLGVDDAQLDSRMKVLKDRVQQHVRDEEKELLPVVRKMFERDELEQLGEEMENLANELLQQGDLRQQVTGPTDEPAHI
ncbi:MAG TPA: hemerythrin domain-containing protein [Anaeromyxobacteraceae bacterium]|nr:hemerythrin domain-containing protein [Anaeromyxobacteraceae bacterium]